MIKSSLQKVFLFVGRGVPPFLAKKIYLIPYYILKLTLPAGDELWFRHSVYFGDIEFAYSDLDLSALLIKSTPEKNEARVRALRFFFPFVGEINYYDEDYLQHIRPYVNRTELKRDPVLTDKLFADENKEGPDHSSQEEKNIDELVFILNWLSHDSHKMREDFKRREKKIKRFLNLMNLDEKKEFQGMEDLLEYLVTMKFSPFFKREEIKKFLIDFSHYDFSHKAANNEFYRDFPEYRKLFLTFFPQRWIGASLHFEEFEEGERLISLLMDKEKIIFLKQINWEIWGLMGQWRKKENSLNLFLHCENLKRLLVPLGPEAQLQVEGLDKLISWQEEIFYQGTQHAG